MGFLKDLFAGLKVAKDAEAAEYERQFGEPSDLTAAERAELPIDGTAYIEEKYSNELNRAEKRANMREAYKAKVNEKDAKAKATSKTKTDDAQRVQE